MSLFINKLLGMAVWFGAMLAGLLSESIFVKKHQQEYFMTRAYCITLLVIVVLASFAGAAQNSGKVWESVFSYYALPFKAAQVSPTGVLVGIGNKASSDR